MFFIHKFRDRFVLEVHELVKIFLLRILIWKIVAFLSVENLCWKHDPPNVKKFRVVIIFRRD